ncbi:NucA/NucB deoxyribonuclease domain-containing protein [Paenibacillus filicis]|uniref:NucA/NucB deoxyribonuclease domain-containing protein n=1 Tax=Paenibacillus filicis TaxID=669464 RepID=A0ABU9DLU2_9BACL
MRIKKPLVRLFMILLVVLAAYLYKEEDFFPSSIPATGSDATATVKLDFPSERYPETGKHIKDAIAAGKSDICTIDRNGAEKNRQESLKGVPVKKGYDRDEWPMAMCREGGRGADIQYISPSDNRGAGSWVSNKLEPYQDGTRVQFIVK